MLGGFKARQVVDLGATYDVTGPDGASIGTFREDAKASLLPSTWHLTQGAEGEQPAVKGTERSAWGSRWPAGAGRRSTRCCRSRSRCRSSTTSTADAPPTAR